MEINIFISYKINYYYYYYYEYGKFPINQNIKII